MASTYGQILDQVVSGIQALSLSGVPSANVVRKKVATLREGDMPGNPCILVSPTGQVAAPVAEGTNLRDDIYYPVLVLFCKTDNQSQVSDDTYLDWHEKVRKKFNNKPLLAVPCVFTCQINPRDTYNVDAWLKNLALGGIVFRFKARELRT